MRSESTCQVREETISVCNCQASILRVLRRGEGTRDVHLVRTSVDI